MTTVLSLGGSIVAPDVPDPEFLAAFHHFVNAYLAADHERRLILVVGGGGPARAWQKAYRDSLEGGSSGKKGGAAAPAGMATRDGQKGLGGEAVHNGEAARDSQSAEDGTGDRKQQAAELSSEAQDWIGIAATRLNAQLVAALLEPWCTDPVVTDPEGDIAFTGRVLVATGWKPGFSTDFDAVVLAERFGATSVLNLSNIAKVYTADPRTNPDAQPIDRIGWAAFRAIVGDEWSPGKNVPFDPVATKKAASLRLTVICAAGRDLDNLAAILAGTDFIGTTIGPD